MVRDDESTIPRALDRVFHLNISTSLENSKITGWAASALLFQTRLQRSLKRSLPSESACTGTEPTVTEEGDPGDLLTHWAALPPQANAGRVKRTAFGHA